MKNKKRSPIKLTVDNDHVCVIEAQPENDILVVPSHDGKSYFVFKMLRYVDK